MAKFVALVCVAAWLAVALPMICCSKDGEQTDSEIKKIENIARQERTQQNWQELAGYYIKNLDKKSKKMSSEEVENLVEALKWLQRYDSQFSLEKFKSESVKELFSFQEELDEISECSRSYFNTIGSFAKDFEKKPKLRAYVISRLPNYLEKCHHDEHYRQAAGLNREKHGTLKKYPSFLMYIEGEFLPKWEKSSSYEPNWLLSVIEDLSRFKEVYEDGKACSSEYKDVILRQNLIRSLKYSHLFELSKDYFKIYLDKCGFEKQFQLVMNRILVYGLENKYQSLDLYLRGEIYPRWAKHGASIDELDQLFSIIKDISEHNKLYETQAVCKDERKSKSLQENIRVSSKKFPYLVEPLNNHFGIYLEACGFEAQFAKVINFNERLGKKNKYDTLYSYVRGELYSKWIKNPLFASWRDDARSPDDLTRLLAIIEYISTFEQDHDPGKHCSEEYYKQSLLDNLSESSNMYPYFFEILEDFFALYLDKCGFEDHFKKATNRNERQWLGTWDKYESLRECLKGELYIKGKKHDLSRRELESVLSVVETLSKFDELYDEIGCKTENRMSDLIYSVVRNKDDHPELFALLVEYFKRSLVTCGFETRLEEVIIKHGVAIDNKQDDSPLASYISKEFLKSKEKNKDYLVKLIKGALQIVDKLHELEKMDLNTCDMKTTRKIADLADDAREPHYNKQFDFIGNIFAEYVEVCARDLKNKVEEFKKNHKETWDPIKKIADEIKTKITQEHEDSERTSGDLAVRIFVNLPDGTRKDQIEKCKVLWAKIKTNIDAIMHDCTPAIKDNEIKEIMNDIAHCDAWRESYRNDLTRNTFIYLNVPNYPTMAKVQEAKPEVCPNWRDRAEDDRFKKL